MDMKTKISVLHFSQVNGGVERYLKLFLKFSDKNKFVNSIISPEIVNYNIYNYLINNSYEVNIKQSFSIIKLFKNVLYIRNIIKQEKPDILYLHSTFAGVIGRLAAIGCGCKVVYNPHGWSFKMNVVDAKKCVYKIIEYILSFLANKIVTISQSEYNAGKQIFINKNKLELIYNGIDTSENNSVESLRLTHITDRYVIGMVGRISEQKNPLFFVEFAKAVHEQYPNSFFIIVGDGELKETVLEKIQEYNLVDNFLITGWVTNPESYIRLFDQAVLFSKWEGFGLAVAEYMLLKKPIIISDIDGMSELITDSVNGIKVELNDISMAVLKSNMLRKNKDFSVYLGENAYSTVKRKFSAENQTRLLEKLFEQLMVEK
ncbi:VI polysaccharide biosynthesis protein [[Actinobacillus] rossii]|uniref:VI polysaccharide biosynthesis protein n=1 Tax=[Actinobacillus] rossii TaxID=123820 RepID=A0A380TR32_9PAST|nr:VI polysaccharide biosynthesis protein [[Actinobacillus] rossii]